MTASHLSLDHTVTRGRALTITLWTGQVLLAVFFAVAADSAGEFWSGGEVEVEA